jgi:methylmalonyl-CoA mutase N-terminal domain/subunit
MTNKKQVKQNEQEIQYSKLVKKQKARKTHFETDAGISIDPLYTHLTEDQYHDKLGFPGMYPYTRGIHSSMYRSRFWTMRQYAGFGTAQESNKRFKYLLQSGTTGLSVAFDLPTQMGLDSDHPLAEGEVGKVGVSICSIADMETLFKDIPLEKVSTSMTINSTASILLALYISIAKKQGTDLRNLSGTIQNDILKEYIARGTFIFPPEPSMRIITDIFKFCHEELPRWNTISISGYHIREAGSTAIQEIAFTLANAIAYVEAAINSGLNIDEFSSRLSFFFNAHNDFFEEIAKFRAARRMWAKIMRERFKAKNEKSLHMRFHVQTGGSTLTAQQPMNNITRVTLQALSAILGGTQSLHTNSFDEALALPTEDSVRIALRTQQIIAQESGIAASIDPLGGSYLIEYLTDEIEKGALDYLKKTDEMGGAIEAIKKGFFQEEITRSAYDYQKKIEANEKIIVGLNSYMINEEPNPEILKIDEEQVRRQIQDLHKFKTNRNSEEVTQSLRKLETATQSNKNIMPYIINCVESFATLGEISDCLRGVFGVYQENTVY